MTVAPMTASPVFESTTATKTCLYEWAQPDTPGKSERISKDFVKHFIRRVQWFSLFKLLCGRRADLSAVCRILPGGQTVAKVKTAEDATNYRYPCVRILTRFALADMPFGRRISHRRSLWSTCKTRQALPGGCSKGLSRSKKSGPSWATATEPPSISS